MAHAPEKTMTADELLAMGDIGPCELIDGELVRMSPGGFEHGIITARLCRILAEYVEGRCLGVITGAETGFKIRRNPDTVRAPDAAFISTARMPKDIPHRGFFEGAPDLAVEVLSPDDRKSDVIAKAQDWLTAGCHIVWIVDPVTHSITEYLPDASNRVLRDTDDLDGGNVLTGFHIRVSKIFMPVS